MDCFRGWDGLFWWRVGQVVLSGGQDGSFGAEGRMGYVILAEGGMCDL